MYFSEQCLKTQQGIDPKQLAAQLEGIDEGDSPAGSQSSSQHEFMTPNMSSSCSSPRSDPASISSDRQDRPKPSPPQHSNSLPSSLPKDEVVHEYKKMRQCQKVAGFMPFPPASVYMQEDVIVKVPI